MNDAEASAKNARETNPPRVSYPLKDADGKLVAVHHRRNKPDGSKMVWWSLPDGTSGLNGTPLGELPLYGSELVSGWSSEDDVPVVVAEGEKAAQALLDAGIRALGTVTGAAKEPGPDALEVLRGQWVVLWPDNDEQGRSHMRRVAAALVGVAAGVCWYEWEGAPEKGDAADHPAVIGRDARGLDVLLSDLMCASAWEPAATQPEHRHRSTRGKGQPPTHDEIRDRFLARHGGEYAFGLGEWRRYEGGVWPPAPEVEVKRRAQRVVEEAKPEGVRPTVGLLHSVLELARIEVAVPDERWDADPDALVCANGTLRVSTRELLPHAPERYATAAVPYAYDPSVAALTWRGFLKETVGEEVAPFLQEFAGYALTVDMLHEIALWLYGPPGSGKSTLLAGMGAMLGPKAGLLGLAEVERNRFALADLPGRTFVMASEQPSAYLASTNVLNAIISGEPLQVERKYRDPVTITPRAKVCWAMNELPRVADANSGLFRRVKVVRFPELPEDRRDPEVKRAIEGEGAGILNWALDGLDRLRERGRFEVPDAVRDASEDFRTSNDVPALFVDDACVVGEELRAQAGQLYAEYRFWCERNGHRPQSSTSIAQDWERLGFVKRKSNGRAYYYGVGLKATDGEG
jgi:P4 family phage/plasmid primase-like protien